MKKHVFILAAALAMSLPLFGQTAPLGQFAHIPTLFPAESIIGLSTVSSQLGLVTTQRQFVSPFAPSTGLLTDTNVAWGSFNIHLLPTTQVTNNPAISNELWMTAPTGFIDSLFKAQPNVTNGNVISTTVSLPSAVVNLPQSLASDGTYAFLIETDRSNVTTIMKIDGTTGDLLASKSVSSGTPKSIVVGADALVYVLDNDGTSSHVTTYNKSDLSQIGVGFQLTRPSNGPMAISSLGQVFVLVTDSTGALAIDTYEPSTGMLLGSTSGATTFSADQNINLGGHPAMFANNGYLYLATGTGQYVWLFSTGPRTPAALNCHGSTISDLAKQYGSTAKAAAAMGYPSVSALQTAIRVSCGI